ncbi:glutamate synthase large subunit [Halosquirtibacter xylanolyticus]|uniref:glutamate synthase large subunit n=1 Tax=Halosquirtibacter xylanolyticus TaxID=3374599 RepID=UPI003748A7FF|nr:glutamate synthase large subunit [Prolixibacteraceae bacterium]
MQRRFPKAQGLYDSVHEHDACGIGFVAQIKGVPSHDIVTRGLVVLRNMDHRGATSSDNQTGDGAGILLQVPHSFYVDKGIGVPENEGTYGTGLIFLPNEEDEAALCRQVLDKYAVAEGLTLLKWRDVPVDSSHVGEIALRTEPSIQQVFYTGNYERDVLERKLYLVRKQAEDEIRNSTLKEAEAFYVCSLSSKVIIYKGMLTPDQLRDYFKDLTDPDFKSAIALVHSRFSTNTFPTWDLAQPFRMMAHNGEINTVKGNRLWMGARESLFKSEVFGDEIKKLYPVVEPGKSDSASLDNTLEFLHMTGRSLPHSMCMLIPESFNKKNPIPESLKGFYEYHSTLMEPWDGPASIVFSDGRYIGGTLDRNGLRPSRYVITKNDMIVMGSEVGVQTFAAEEIKEKGRLRPGKLLLVDTKLGIIIPDKEVKADLSRRYPYVNWLKENRLMMDQLEVKQRVPSSMGKEYALYSKTFGYSKEDLTQTLKPMAETGKEPTGSMGNDVPFAVFSEKPQRLFSYFRQLFAQVTNPPIDPIREGLVMSLTNYIGSLSTNILDDSPEHCKLVKFDSPIITNTDLGKIKDLKHDSFTHAIIPMVFRKSEGEKGLKKAIDVMLKKAEEAVDQNKNFIILSDRHISPEMAPIPSLLATSAVHHYLIEKKKRMQVGLIVESAEPREVMHFALLVGYGASAINPYLSFASINEMVSKGEINKDYAEARKNFIKSIDAGLLKVLSKMGISTLRSYHGAQLFEAVGIGDELVEKYFKGTPSRIGGISYKEIYQEAVHFHDQAFESTEAKYTPKSSGVFSYRQDGEHHAWNPQSIGLLQWSTKVNDYKMYKKYSKLVDEENAKPAFIRGLLKWKKNPIDISEVEPVENIMKRFVTGAMSYGSISKEAHEALAMAMNAIGGRSNTGEGGEDPSRFSRNTRSSIKQIASGRFGVTNNYLVNADELQIKVAQGAKPGEGGQLPGFKVNKIIAKTRNSTPGITLISPPPHHDIYSIEDLSQLIYDLKCVNPQAKISVKLVSEVGVGTIAAGVSKAHSDLIVISGSDGGTGASPMSSIKHAGLPVEMGIAETQQTLVMNNLRGRVKLQADGQLKNGTDVVKLALLGAEEFGFSTSALIVLGCVMMRKCHLNTCPAGIATQSEELRQRFLGKSQNVINFFTFIAEEIRENLAELGFKKFDDIVGRADLLETDDSLLNWKMQGIDLSKLIHVPAEAKKFDIHNTHMMDRDYSKLLDTQMLQMAKKAIKNKDMVWFDFPVQNTDRTVGALLSGEVSKKYGEEGLPDNTIHSIFHGSAGQSFGAFLTKGITFRLQGDSNDYLGKGLSGGRVIVVPPSASTFVPENNIIVGNTTLYGATSGEVYIRGIAGERFAVRNSGATAVVEGSGDHCCEYMTGGRVVVLGETGKNFAAGMSGGIAYVYDVNGDFEYFCNKGLVELSPVEDRSDIRELQQIISNHMDYTQSSLAANVLSNWEESLTKFIKVIPLEYKKVLNEMKLAELNRKLQLAEDDPSRHE